MLKEVLCRLSVYFYSIDIIFRLWKKTGVLYKNVRAVGGSVDLNVKGLIELPHDGVLTFVNDAKHSTLGISRTCKLSVYKEAKLIFHGQFGMSNTVVVATKRVEIGKNVIIGGGVTIVDSDFHSLNYNDWFTVQDENNMISKDVVIGDNVFIGMNSIILKGVTIGDRAVIAAGSVVSKNIPSDEVWGGNPAVFIKSRKVK